MKCCSASEMAKTSTEKIDQLDGQEQGSRILSPKQLHR